MVSTFPMLHFAGWPRLVKTARCRKFLSPPASDIYDRGKLVVEHDVEKRTVNLQFLAVVFDEAHFSELVHEEIDSRAGCAHHLSQSLLTDLRDHGFGLSVLAKMSQQQQHPGKSFFAGIEKLVNQVLFISEVPRQQICYEHVGQRMFPVKHFHHVFLVDFHHIGIGHCGCREQAESLPCEAAFSEEIALVQNPYRGFLPALRHYGESYLSFLYIKNSVRWVTLNKDRLLLGKLCDLSTAVNGRKECLSIEFAAFLRRCPAFHDRPRFESFECAECNLYEG
jgi:hypothetical protein